MTEPTQSPPRRPDRGPAPAATVDAWIRYAPWLGVVALAAWLGLGLAAGWLALAAVAFVVPILRPGPRGRVPVCLAGLVLVVGGFVVEGQQRRVTLDWDARRTAREERVAALLEARLDALVREGRAGVTTLARASEAGPPPVALLRRVRRGGGFDAAAIYDAEGRMLVWDGLHRGAVPPEVATTGPTYQFGARALAKYLYVTEPTPDGGVAMLARMLDSDLPGSVRRSGGDLAIQLEEAVDGTSLTFTNPDRAGAEDASIFDYGTADATLVSVRIRGISASERLTQIERETRRFGTPAVAVLWVFAALLLGGGWMGAGAGLALAGLLPLRSVPGFDALSSPADALLAGQPLGRWLWVVAVACITVAVLRRGRASGRTTAGLGALVVVLGAPGVVHLLQRSMADGFLPPWIAFGALASLAIGLVVRGGIELESLRRRRVDAAPEAGPSTVGRARDWAVGLLATAGLAVIFTIVTVERPGLPALAAAGAALPVLLWRRVLDGSMAREAVAWALAFLVGSSIALPTILGERIEARRVVAETQMARLGVDDDPYAELLLREMAARADSLDAVGLRPVELLYQTWRTSGLGAADYPIHLTLWLPSGAPREDLRIGDLPVQRPSVAAEAFRRTSPGDPPRVEKVTHPWGNYVLTVPLREGRVLTGVVPPIREVGRATLLGPLFESLDARSATPLSLIPQQEDEGRIDRVEWSRSAGGWTGELSVRYPESEYHAHWELALPPVLVVVARGSLLATAVGGLGLLLVGLGVVLFAPGVSGTRALRDLLGPVGSYRTRITIVLFGFFALSNLVFGSLAYRTIEGASRRAAEVLATRAADEAGEIYLEVDGVIDFLAQRVGTEVLEYRDGALREGSIEPLVELGLYEAWVPWEIQQALSERERTGGMQTTELGPWRYVTAFGRLPDGDVIGAPVPLDAGADAVRQAEVRDLLAFAMLVGAAISLLLALAAGRALARPISTLRVASERVGAGNLAVALPAGRPDEFGAVFDAFNRMVAGLRRARSSLERTNRRTRAIVAEAATGVIAVDPRGTVSLVNERARALLDVPVREGMPVAARELGEVGRWLERYMQEGPLEAAREIQVGERRIRVRVRRILDEEERSGAVVSLEDVTDELRTERVLAWGEMARQVAHEVKNPLTPIKLSVQHVQRAWRDRRADFDEILERNAEAMLREIDRLSEIASSFSRLGAPEAAGAPVEAVDLRAVVGEVLALYRGGQGSLDFRSEVEEGLPTVRARRTEMKEVLVNLLENSRDAMPSGGSVVVDAEREGEDVVLAVSDDGPGVDPALLARVFEPHFSTRSTGTGLGLAIVQRLVESWGGEVTLVSEPGAGTVVRVRMRVSG